MKHHVLKLSAIARKRTRLIIGLMSGTSLDGLDVALCSLTGFGQRTRAQVLQFETMPYDEVLKTEIRRVFAKKEIEFQHLVLLNVLVAERHAALVNQCLAQWKIKPEAIDLLASHGQTVFHAPRVFHGLPNYPNATLQIGDGDHLALRTGIITVSDFRQKHLAAGGEGAPLALYGDYFLFSKKGEDRYLLNIGGIANFTYLPDLSSQRHENQDPVQAFATDTGPGNTLLDAFVRKLFGVAFDEDARLASNGRVDERLLEILKSEPFFAKPLPKTTGPELFSLDWASAAIAQLPKGNLNPYDIMATLTRLTADTIAEAILRVAGGGRKAEGGGFPNLNPGHSGPIPNSQFPIPNSPIPNSPIPQSLFLSGGGAHNPLILKLLKEKLPGLKIAKMDKLGIHGDAKEAVLFAVLANETVAGRVGSVLGGIPMVGMGKVSFPG